MFELSKEMMWVVYLGIIVAGGAVGWYVGKQYDSMEMGVGIGIVGGLVASGAIYMFMNPEALEKFQYE